MHLEEAQNKLNKADYILTQTYNSIKDPKILVVIVESIAKSMELLIDALLIYYRKKGLVKGVPSSLDAKKLFFDDSVTFESKEQVLELLNDSESVLKAKRESPVEFRRNQTFVMCSEGYNIKKLDYEATKDMLKKAKLFINQAHTLVDGNAVK